ncbi:MAG: hypothetical protein A2W91_19805 [Bacteroidetes bacterium GWF2_38_335]|nr:MAG: hypothetical protein A2W91_19805 [Bacteroidetes bacterium GWF2_38_335]OFY79264.1 MAG: hypothetical protein A2281_15850 [Bacteroidetes bacterium RIFOXYA12_FULL_38_20]HBS86463.1 hypothetical protein [Bacteroidales bacterium]
MKKKLLFTVAATVLFFTNISFGQAPTMGSTVDYVLFTSSGAVGNTGISHITGNVGTQVGAITTFGNVDGVLHTADLSTTTAATDLAALYSELSTTTTTATHEAVLGTGEILVPGVYQIAAAGSITGTLTLDAGGDENALFIFKIGGAFTTAAGTEVILLNNAKACNVFWIAEGAIGMAAGTIMKGTLIANNAAISMAAGGLLEGRMFSTIGAVAIDGTTARLPLGCDLPILNGPVTPTLATTECFALYTANGALTNTAVTNVTGDVGTNVGATTGFVSEDVVGTIHLVPDAATATCATDLTLLHTYLNTLLVDIELLYPATVGNKLVLTPHTYLLDAETVITDTLFLNAQNNADAVFVLSITGALSTSVGATVALMNGAQAKNVFWVVNGNVSLNTNSKFIGTIVSDNGTIDIAMEADLDGRALTTNGIFTTNNISAIVPTMCSSVDVCSYDVKNEISVYPNPFNTYININLNNISTANHVQISIYNVVGEVVIKKSLVTSFNTVETSGLPSGIYFYNVFDQNGTLQTGRIVSQ